MKIDPIVAEIRKHRLAIEKDVKAHGQTLLEYALIQQKEHASRLCVRGPQPALRRRTA